MDDIVCASLACVAASAQIRCKPSYQGSMEEKQWVGLDMLVNPEMYKSLCALKHKAVRLDDAYRTDLGAADVSRILELPHDILKSLPYQESPSEIRAHELLMTYTHEDEPHRLESADGPCQECVSGAPARGTLVS